MSIVPSEIEFQSDSDDAAPSTRISGVTVIFMLGLLAAGFGTVGYLAMGELSGAAPRLAHSQDGAESLNNEDVAKSEEPAPEIAAKDVSQDDAVTIDPSTDIAPPEKAPRESILDDAAEFVVAEASPQDADAPAEMTPSIKPPTVTYDAAVFDDMAPDTDADDVETQPDMPVESLAPNLDAPAEPADPAPPETRAPAENSVDEPSETTEPQIDVSEPAEDTPPPPDLATTPPQPEPSTPETATPEPPVETATSETIDPLSGSHVVQLASYRSEDEAMADWARIETRLGTYLAGKTYQIQRADLGDRGIYFRLRIGPFASSDTAQAYCAGLKERGQDCLALRR